jgi:hypothetical protein
MIWKYGLVILQRSVQFLIIQLLSWACVVVCFIRVWYYYSTEQELLLLIKVTLLIILQLFVQFELLSLRLTRPNSYEAE